MTSGIIGKRGQGTRGRELGPVLYRRPPPLELGEKERVKEGYRGFENSPMSYGPEGFLERRTTSYAKWYSATKGLYLGKLEKGKRGI